MKKCISCCLSRQNPHTCLFRAVLSCKRCLICADFSPDSDQNTFSLEEVLLKILAECNGLKLKCFNDELFLLTNSFCLLKMLIDGLEWCGLLVDYCDVFISCLDSYSDGTHSHSLVSKWCNATFLQIWWRIKLIYILDGLRVRTFPANFQFWMNCFFKD